jgi:SPW repeat
MNVISSKTHGVLDYLVGIILIAAPWIFGFASGGAETWVPVVLGAGTLLYSLMTNYELGAIRMISFPAHLAIDAIAGIFLAASPWLFNFNDQVYLPHLVLGIMELLVVMLSQRVPFQRHAPYHHRNLSGV